MTTVQAVSARTPLRGNPQNLRASVEKSADKEPTKKSFPEPRVFDRDGNGKVDVMDVVQERLKVNEVSLPVSSKNATQEYQLSATRYEKGGSLEQGNPTKPLLLEA